MALIKCKECGQAVSDKATACPKCGCPISVNEVSEAIMVENSNQKTKNSKWLFVFVIAFLAIVLSGGIWWSLNNNKETVKITPEFSEAIKKYERLGDFREGLALAQYNGKWGYIDVKGREVIPCQFEGEERGGYGHNFSDGMAIIIEEGKYGYINNKGDVVIKPQYAEAADFSEGMAVVMTEWNGKLIFIDKRGHVMEKLSNKYVWDFNTSRTLPQFYNGVCEVHSELPKEERSEGDWVKRLWVDIKGNEVKEPQEQEKTREYEIFWEEDGKKGYKDKEGNIVIPAKYSTIGELSYGVAVATLEWEEKSMWKNAPNYVSIYGYVDLNGNETFTQDDYNKIAQAKKDEEERARQEEIKKREGTEIVITLHANRTGRNISSFTGNYGAKFVNDECLRTNKITVPTGKVWIFKKYELSGNLYQPHIADTRTFMYNYRGTTGDVIEQHSMFKKMGGETFFIDLALSYNKDTPVDLKVYFIEKDENYY